MNQMMPYGQIIRPTTNAVALKKGNSDDCIKASKRSDYLIVQAIKIMRNEDYISDSRF